MGGFLLTEWAEGLERYYTPGREIEVFHSLAELAEKIDYYLVRPAERDAIAQAGYERTCREHTYNQRLAEVLDFALCQREKYFADHGVTPTGRIDWAKFEAAARQHTVDKKLSSLRRGMTAICSAIWGPVRGPRAARRILFELSWRLVGARTYSAAGWPGRIFYHVS